MNVKRIAGMALIGGLLSACAAQMNSVWSSIESTSKNRIQFEFPAGDRWEVVDQQRDSGGYSRSWRPITVKGAAAEQSLFINFGRDIKTSMTESMQQVKTALLADHCKAVSLRVWSKTPTDVTFTASASKCQTGHPVWQIFRVANRSDGQYAVVYSANPDAVPVAERQQMAQAVEKSTVVAQTVSASHP